MQEVFYPTQTLRATSEQPPDETADSGALFAEPFYVVFSTFKMFRYYFGPKLRVAPIDYEYFSDSFPSTLRILSIPPSSSANTASCGCHLLKIRYWSLNT